jgi:cytochrome c-type biogenesis protein CcmE
VRYRGPVPDLFGAGRQVVVEGTMSDGVLEADVLLTKCASKYEARTVDGAGSAP